MDIKLTNSSLDNYKDVQYVKNKVGGEGIHNKNNLLKYRDIYNFVENMYTQTGLYRVEKEKEKVFDPKSEYSNRLLQEVFTIDGLNNPDSKVSKEYFKLNMEYTDKIVVDDIIFVLNFYYTHEDVYNLISVIMRRFKVLMNIYSGSDRLKHIRECLGNKPFRVYFLLYDVNRYVPDIRSDDIYNDIRKLKDNGTYNCSSGYTAFFSDRRRMLISRIPECLGLLTHELGHLLGWDLTTTVKSGNLCTLSGMVQQYDFSGAIKYLEKLPLKSKDIIPYEIYCNTFTTILHTICNSIEAGKSYDKFVEMVIDEIYYSIYHSAKILYYHGYDSYKDFFMNSENKLKYVQNAALFEYTIVRSFILLNLLENGTIVKELTDMLHYMTTYNKLYESIFDNFVGVIKNKKKLNMEYFLYDINYSERKYEQRGGNIDYYRLYKIYYKMYKNGKYM